MPNRTILLGYTDKPSSRNSDIITFKTSSPLPEDDKTHPARIISTTPNPNAPGMTKDTKTSHVADHHPSRPQPFHPNSHASIDTKPPPPSAPALPVFHQYSRFLNPTRRDYPPSLWSMRPWESVPGPLLSAGGRIPRIAWTRCSYC